MAMSGVIFELYLFREPGDRERSQKTLLWLMEVLARHNQSWIETHPTPKLFESGVHYFFDPKLPDPWQDIPTTIEKGNGDCEDLACWRIAELRVEGIAAMPHIRWRKKDGRYIYHALLRWPDGRIEDPSVALGMKGPMIYKPVFLKGTGS